jgi:hypothetical protein
MGSLGSGSRIKHSIADLTSSKCTNSDVLL